MNFLNEKRNTVGLSNIELSDYLKAGYSFIQIRTTEDDRALDLIQSSVKSNKKLSEMALYEWKSTSGLRKSDKEGEGVYSAGVTILDALQVVIDESPIIMVAYNVRSFLQAPQVIQKLKDASDEARLNGSVLILVGPQFDMPPEISNIVTLYDLDLPTQEEFREDFKGLAHEYRSLISYDDTDITKAAASAIGLTKLQGENALALSIIKTKSINQEIIQREKEQCIKKSDVLQFLKVNEDMSTLGGFQVFKEWIAKRKNAFSQEAREFGIKNFKGILIVGVSGTGKSHVSKVIASYLGTPLIKFDLGKVFRGIQGSSEQAVRDALKVVEAVSPCCLLLDEVEKSISGSESSGKTDSGTTARVIGTLLTWMNDCEKPVFICATANHPERLPAELMRKGRFAEIWGVQEPNLEEREEIWYIHTNKVRRGHEFDWKRLAELSHGYTGAEIESIVNDSLFEAFDDNKRELSIDDLIKGINDVIPQSITMKDKIDEMRMWMQDKVRMVSIKDITTKKDTIDKIWNRKLKIEESVKC